MKGKGAAAPVVTAIAAAGVAFALAAHADAQYKADRVYCTSGEASEARDVCLKEVAATQTDRQRGSHCATGHPGVKSNAPASSGVAPILRTVDDSILKSRPDYQEYSAFPGGGSFYELPVCEDRLTATGGEPWR